MGRILVRLDLLPSLRGIPWVPHRQAPEHFMVELWKPRLVPSDLVELGTSVIRVLSWAKPCSASWDLCVVCTFLKKKVLPFGCSPRASCYLAQGAWGSFLVTFLILRRKAPRFLCWKRGSDLAVFGFFLSYGPDAVCLEEAFWVVCAFLERKVHSLSVAPSLLLFGTKSWRVLNLSCLIELYTSPFAVPEHISGLFC